MSDEQIVRAWVIDSLPEVESHGLAQRDFDELTGRQASGDVARRALALFETVIQCLTENDSSAVAMLYVPIPTSERLTTEFPDLESYIDSFPTEVHTPPGFYLSRPDNWSDWGGFEVYRTPLRQLSAYPFASPFYGTERTVEDRQSGWEYSRGFYFLASDRP